MVTANKDCSVRRFAGSTVVLVEVAYGAELLRDRHGIEIVGVPDCLCLLVTFYNDMSQTDLEVTPNDEEVNAIPIVDFT